MYTDAVDLHLAPLFAFAREHPDLAGDFPVEDALGEVTNQVLDGPAGPGSTMMAAERALGAVDTYLFVAATALAAPVPGPTLAAAENLKDDAKRIVARLLTIASEAMYRRACAERGDQNAQTVPVGQADRTAAVMPAMHIQNSPPPSCRATQDQ